MNKYDNVLDTITVGYKCLIYMALLLGYWVYEHIFLYIIICMTLDHILITKICNPTDYICINKSEFILVKGKLWFSVPLPGIYIYFD